MKRLLMLLFLLLAASPSHAIDGGAGWHWNKLNDTFQAGGDFRYRNEGIKEASEEFRYRQKIRMRGIMAARLSDELHFITRIGSGPSDSPLSMNQQLDGGFTSKPLWIDVASLCWSPSGISGLTLAGGKLRTPFRDTGALQLIFDSDISPEGMSAKYHVTFAETGLFVNAGTFVVDERSEGRDVQLSGVQAGAERTVGAFALTLGTSYYHYLGAKGHAPFYGSSGRGNALDSEGNYAHGFEEFELFSDATGRIGRLPVKLFVDGVMNRAVNDDNLGIGTGFTLGKCKSQGDFECHYEYKRLEKNSVAGIFADSSFVGGSSDGKRHKVSFGYKFADKIQGKLSYQHNTKGLANGEAYHVMQIDVLCWL